VRRLIADTKPGFPDRIMLRDAEPGERCLLLNYTHQPADNPHRASHAIFILKGATARYDAIGIIAEVLRIRPISLRGFNSDDEMDDADLVDGADLAAAIEKMFRKPGIAYMHAHYAKRGCYAARVDRAEAPNG